MQLMSNQGLSLSFFLFPAVPWGLRLCSGWILGKKQFAKETLEGDDRPRALVDSGTPMGHVMSALNFFCSEQGGQTPASTAHHHHTKTKVDRKVDPATDPPKAPQRPVTPWLVSTILCINMHRTNITKYATSLLCCIEGKRATRTN